MRDWREKLGGGPAFIRYEEADRFIDYIQSMRIIKTPWYLRLVEWARRARHFFWHAWFWIRRKKPTEHIHRIIWKSYRGTPDTIVMYDGVERKGKDAD